MTLTQLKYTGLYNLPGQGLVAAFDEGGETLLFDRQGLQHRILTKQSSKKDTTVEERALAEMNAIRSPDEYETIS